MTQQLVNLSEAARLANVSRSTISRDKKSGKLSVANDMQGKPVVAISELVRLYGNVTQHDDSHYDHDTHDTSAELQPQIDLLKQQVKQLESQLLSSLDREKNLMVMVQGVPKLESKPKKRGVLGRVVCAALDIE